MKWWRWRESNSLRWRLFAKNFSHACPYTCPLFQNSQPEDKGKFALRYVVCLLLPGYNSHQSNRRLTHHFGLLHGLSVRLVGPSQHPEHSRYSSILASGQIRAKFWLGRVAQLCSTILRNPLFTSPTPSPQGPKVLIRMIVFGCPHPLNQDAHHLQSLLDRFN